MNRIDRLVAILTTLQSRKFVTAEFIADKYEISDRTVYRDLKALGEIGIPIDFESNKGYSILQGFFWRLTEIIQHWHYYETLVLNSTDGFQIPPLRLYPDRYRSLKN